MSGAVTASTQEAADAGAEALRAGGNAVDAIVAAALASCVADPANTGLGGYGGYMIVQRRGEAARCIAFPLWPPSSIDVARLEARCPDAGPACSTVPNVVGGLARALREFGRRDWSAASGAAIRLARDGVVANRTTLRAFAMHRGEHFLDECFELSEPDGESRVRFRQPNLAATLERMAGEGPQWFYTGRFAEAAIAAWRTVGLDVPLADWTEQDDAVFIEDAVAHSIDGVRLYATPPGLTGSACTLAFVTAAARAMRDRLLEAPETLADVAQAMARTWRYRFSLPHRNEFTRSTLARWIDSALAFDDCAAAPQPASEHTAHLNAVDAGGTIAALTFTHGPAWFGGRWSLARSGVLMNGGMHNFGRGGLVRRGARRYGVSNMSPTLAERCDGTRVAVGCPGARRIPSNVALVLARFLFGGAALAASVTRGRFHSETGDCVHAEIDRLGEDVVAALRKRFAEVLAERADNYFGPLTAIAHSAAGEIEAAVDDRDFRGFRAVAP